jgi:DegV family protein with EDD domain
MVPLKVLFGEDTYLDWIDLSPEQFYDMLGSSAVLPKTSQPSPADFAAAYSSLVESGCEAIVSIHLTSALSGTFESATMAAVDSAIPIHIVDTKLVSQATALAVKAAVAARDAGSDADTIAARATDVAARTRFFFVLDTLEYLVKGGRAGKASGLAASVLNIKPILTFNDEGRIEPFKKVKGTRKALAVLVSHVATQAQQHGHLTVSLLNGCSPETTRELEAAIAATGADVDIESTGAIGAVIGTYAGPKAVGCAFYPTE